MPTALGTVLVVEDAAHRSGDRALAEWMNVPDNRDAVRDAAERAIEVYAAGEKKRLEMQTARVSRVAKKQAAGVSAASKARQPGPATLTGTQLASALTAMKNAGGVDSIFTQVVQTPHGNERWWVGAGFTLRTMATMEGSFLGFGMKSLITAAHRYGKNVPPDDLGGELRVDDSGGNERGNLRELAAQLTTRPWNQMVLGIAGGAGTNLAIGPVLARYAGEPGNKYGTDAVAWIPGPDGPTLGWEPHQFAGALASTDGNRMVVFPAPAPAAWRDWSHAPLIPPYLLAMADADDTLSGWGVEGANKTITSWIWAIGPVFVKKNTGDFPEAWRVLPSGELSLTRTRIEPATWKAFLSTRIRGSHSPMGSGAYVDGGAQALYARWVPAAAEETTTPAAWRLYPLVKVPGFTTGNILRREDELQHKGSVLALNPGFLADVAASVMATGLDARMDAGAPLFPVMVTQSYPDGNPVQLHVMMPYRLDAHDIERYVAARDALEAGGRAAGTGEGAEAPGARTRIEVQGPLPEVLSPPANVLARVLKDSGVLARQHVAVAPVQVEAGGARVQVSETWFWAVRVQSDTAGRSVVDLQAVRALLPNGVQPDGIGVLDAKQIAPWLSAFGSGPVTRFPEVQLTPPEVLALTPVQEAGDEGKALAAELKLAHKDTRLVWPSAINRVQVLARGPYTSIGGPQGFVGGGKSKRAVPLYAAVAASIAGDDNRYGLNGASWESTGVIAGTDGNRLHVVYTGSPPPYTWSPNKLLIPRAIMLECARTGVSVGVNASLASADNLGHVPTFACGLLLQSARVGEFPDWRQVVPSYEPDLKKEVARAQALGEGSLKEKELPYHKIGWVFSIASAGALAAEIRATRVKGATKGEVEIHEDGRVMASWWLGSKRGNTQVHALDLVETTPLAGKVHELTKGDNKIIAFDLDFVLDTLDGFALGEAADKPNHNPPSRWYVPAGSGPSPFYQDDAQGNPQQFAVVMPLKFRK